MSQPSVQADGASGPFLVLFRAFFSQFFTSDWVTSDVQLRQSIIWVLAFLLTPCLYFMGAVLPSYEIVKAVAALKHAPEMVETLLAQLAFLFVTYSMVTIGCIAVLVWDALSFDRRDAMVFGPLPLASPAIIGAKLLALASFVLGASLAVNVVVAIPYALVTGGDRGAAGLGWHLAGTWRARLGPRRSSSRRLS